MVTFAAVALIAGGLFGTGTLVKPTYPVLGTSLQGAAVGGLVGGALGAAAGTASGTASVLGTVVGTPTIIAASLIGAEVVGLGSAYYADRENLNPPTPTRR